MNARFFFVGVVLCSGAVPRRSVISGPRRSCAIFIAGTGQVAVATTSADSEGTVKRVPRRWEAEVRAAGNDGEDEEASADG